MEKTVISVFFMIQCIVLLFDVALSFENVSKIVSILFAVVVTHRDMLLASFQLGFSFLLFLVSTRAVTRILKVDIRVVHVRRPLAIG